MKFRRTLRIALVAAAATLSWHSYAEPGARFLDQGWSDAQRALYHYTSQGTLFLPSAFLEALENANGARFMAPENLRQLGFIYDGQYNTKNPYNWPIGFVVDADEHPSGVPQAGFTCSACHTGQVSYKGQRIQIDGGQSHIDVARFFKELNSQIVATTTDAARRARFLDRAAMLGYPKERLPGDVDHLGASATATLAAAKEMGEGSALMGPSRLDAVNDIANQLFATGLAEPKNFHKGTAPASYPYLWEIWRFDWVQYNASARQPMTRNIIEGLATGRYQMVDSKGNLLPEDERWKTTLRVRNIRDIETTLQALKPPSWPEDILGPIDRERYAKGKTLFSDNCSGCHGIQVIQGTNEWHVPVIDLTKVGTDSNHAINFAGRRYDASKLGATRPMSVADGFAAIAPPIKRLAYLDAGIPEGEWPEFDGFGREDVATRMPCGYKARPLVGAWATAPFLHNGAIPSVYDLLNDARPATFELGGNDIDPTKLGLSEQGGPGAIVVDTALSGNSNLGHWFTNDDTRAGRIGRGLAEDERYALIEYLKGVTLDDYPVREIKMPGPPPCADNPDWAVNR